MQLDYRYIHFVKAAPGHYRCQGHDGSPLGQVEWHRPWRRYVFNPTSLSVVFDPYCLEDIAHFLRQLPRKSPKTKE